MANSVSQSCRSYFQGFQEISTFRKNNSYKNLVGIFKVASYFTVIIPLLFGLVYGASSLISRITRGNPRSSENRKMASVAQRKFAQSVEEQLEQLFQSQMKAQKLFTIDGSKVGVIFSPLREVVQVGYMNIFDHVVLISDKRIPDEVSARITAKIPTGHTHTTLFFGRLNGQPILSALGFE